MDGWWRVVALLSGASWALGVGRHSFECPDGFAVRRVESGWTDSGRQYSFGCAVTEWAGRREESCRQTTWEDEEPGGDLALSCDADELLVGVSRLSGASRQRWSLLCCRGPSRPHNCRSTALLNEEAAPLLFSASSGLLLQGMFALRGERQGDLRWWLRLCRLSAPSSHLRLRPRSRLRFTRSVAPSRFELSFAHRRPKPAYHLSYHQYRIIRIRTRYTPNS